VPEIAAYVSAIIYAKFRYVWVTENNEQNIHRILYIFIIYIAYLLLHVRVGETLIIL
jgi:hypothetical protein